MSRVTLFHRLALAALLPLFCVANAQAQTTAPATLRLDLEQAVIAPRDDAVDLHVLIRIDGAAAPVIDPTIDDRLPLNLGLVLDTSGSMADARKWDYAREAAYKVIDRLSTEDRLSISTYSNRAKVLAAQDDLSRPEALRSALAALYPDGGTNISAGLKNNARLLSFGKGDGRLTRLVLMSDGLANEGIESIDGMSALVGRMASDGTTVSAIGLGADYDEEMLRAIAQAGNGNYYYVESPSQVSTIFDQEVRGLFQTVAEDLRLNLVSAPGVKADLLNDIAFAEQRFDLGTLRYDESIVLIARFTVPRAVLGEDLDLGAVQVSLKERETGRLILIEEPLSVRVSSDAAMVAGSQKSDVTAERALVEIEQAEKEAAKLAAKGDYDTANTVYATALNRLSAVTGALEDRVSQAQLNTLAAKQQALTLQSQRLSEPNVDASRSVKSANQSLFYASKGQRKLSVMQRGDKGFEIENLQQALRREGYTVDGMEGVFDGDLETVVRAFQQHHGLKVDGIAGPATLAKLGLF